MVKLRERFIITTTHQNHRRIKAAIKVIFFLLFIFLIITTVYLIGYSTDFNLEQATHKVEFGETLWSISQQYKPEGMHIQDYIHRVREINQLENVIIYPGQTIKVLIQEGG